MFEDARDAGCRKKKYDIVIIRCHMVLLSVGQLNDDGTKKHRVIDALKHREHMPNEQKSDNLLSWIANAFQIH